MSEDSNEADALKQQHPGFTIACDKCGSHRIEIKNTLGYSPESGSWGDISLVCLDCGNKTEIVEG